MPLNFAERFCGRFHVPREHYENQALAQTLFPHPRLLRPLLEWLSPDFFAVDRTLIRGLGYLSDQSTFNTLAHWFVAHPRNHRFLRHRLRLRASLCRTEKLLRQASDERATASSLASSSVTATSTAFPSCCHQSSQ